MAIIEMPVSEETLRNEVAKYVFTSKYARYLPEKKRRETYEEAVGRVEGMHLRKFSHLPESDLDEIRWAFDLVREKKVYPSMRSMQFGGTAVEKNNLRLYNCCLMHLHSIRSFSEFFFALLSGCGVGVSLTHEFLDMLPRLLPYDQHTDSPLVYTIEDSIEGWADSLEVLLSSYFEGTLYSGRMIVFDYSKIRPAGTPLLTSGGKAPGPDGLRLCHERISSLLNRWISVDLATPIQSVVAYDILMHASDAVLSGGVRRSACLVLFDRTDELMLNAKTGNWFAQNPQRARSNNSVMLPRGEVGYEEFVSIFLRTKEWGEPGFVFVDDTRTVVNPCGEVGCIPIASNGLPGMQMCNLTSLNGAKVRTLEDFLQFAKAAAIIGTLQASYTSFPYLTPEAQEITEDEALLGVSILSALENPEMTTNPEYQRLAAQMVVETNIGWASKIGINPASRCCVEKPDGTQPLVDGSMFSGIHGAEDRYMFRRIQANRIEAPYQLFKSLNPSLTDTSIFSPETDDFIIFPVKVPDGGLLKRDMTAIQHLDIVKSMQENWIEYGASPTNKKPVSHSVSCTVIVKDEEWDDVCSYLFNNKDNFATVSFLPDGGGKKYQQAPMEAVVTDEDWEKFNHLVNNLIPVDYTYMVEDNDGTAHKSEASCAGGLCELR